MCQAMYVDCSIVFIVYDVSNSTHRAFDGICMVLDMNS